MRNSCTAGLKMGGNKLQAMTGSGEEQRRRQSYRAWRYKTVQTI